MFTTKQLAVFLVVLLASVGGAYGFEYVTSPYTTYPEAATIGQGNPSFDEILKRFGDLAKHKGAPYAFDVLRVAELPQNTDIHLVAHTIGHELYAQQGINGMSICTQEFGNGCSHSLVIEAMQELGDGDDVRALIDHACHIAAEDGSNAYTMCYHGLGHGVFAYYGYSFPKTVAFCMKTGTAEYHFEQAYECIGGAAMELVSGGGHDKELWQKANDTYFSKSDPLAPCDSDIIPKDAKPRCYVYLSPHYMESAGANMQYFTPEQLTTGMGVCTALPYGNERSACIGGFGKDFVGLVNGHDLRARDQGKFTDEQLRQVENLCKATPDKQDVMVCEAYALTMFFWGGVADPKLSIRFCSALSDGESQDYCFRNLASNIAYTFKDEKQRSVRCDDLAERYQEKCRAHGT